MQLHLLQQQIKREINKVRREAGHNRPVPEEIWQVPTVKNALAAALSAVETDQPDFEFDYTLAEKTTALNKAITMEYERRALEPRGAAEHFPQRHLPRRDKGGSGIAHGTPAERHCGQAVAEYMAREMEQDDKVRQFRSDFLGGELLTLEEAWAILNSPLHQLLCFYDFGELGSPWAFWPGTIVPFVEGAGELPLPLRDHEVKLRKIFPHDHWAETDETWFVVKTEAPGCEGVERSIIVSRHSAALRGCYPLITEREFRGEAGPLVEPPLEQFESPWGPAGQEYTEQWMAATNASVVDHITDLAFDLMGCDWPISLGDALRFLLTGMPPYVPPVSVNIVTRTPDLYRETANEADPDHVSWELVDGEMPLTRAVLFVQPWVLPEALAEFWKKTRIGVSRTMPLVHNVLIFRFVIKNTPPGQPFQWQLLADNWNAEQGQSLSRSTMQLIFTRTRASLLPGYRAESGGTNHSRTT